MNSYSCSYGIEFHKETQSWNRKPAKLIIINWVSYFNDPSKGFHPQQSEMVELLAK